MLFLTLFQFLTRLLTSKHLKIFSTYPRGRKETMWKTCFSSPQIAKKRISWYIKTKCATDFLLTVSSSSMKNYTFNYVVITQKTTFTLISIRIMRIWKFFFTSNRVFKHKEVVSNLHVCCNGFGIMWPSYIVNFSTRILTSTHKKVINIFSALYMSRCPTINIQLSIISKWLVKHIITKVSFKITIRKRHVYIDIGWPWMWNQCFYFGIWNDDRIKMIVLRSSQLANRLNSQNTNETEFINEIWHFNLFMNIGISNWHNRNFD